MSDRKKLLFIYNPHSGKAQIRSNLLDIIDTFVKAGYEVTAYPTQAPGDAIDAVMYRSPGFHMIACSGGDGTLDEVVGGIMKSEEKLPIGYIPAGSTNDFARSLKIPRSMLSAAGVVTDGVPFACDVGAINGEYYVYVAAFGIFTEVTYQTPQDVKNTLGYSAYILEAIKSLPSIKPVHVRVKWEEGEIEDDFLYGMVTNSYSVGGFNGITGHQVSLNDGYHDVTLIRNPVNPVELSNIVRAMVDRRLDSDKIITFKSKDITFESNEPLRWTRDGEFGGEHTRTHLEVFPHAVSIMIPGDSPVLLP